MARFSMNPQKVISFMASPVLPWILDKRPMRRRIVRGRAVFGRPTRQPESNVNRLPKRQRSGDWIGVARNARNVRFRPGVVRRAQPVAARMEARHAAFRRVQPVKVKRNRAQPLQGFNKAGFHKLHLKGANQLANILKARKAVRRYGPPAAGLAAAALWRRFGRQSTKARRGKKRGKGCYWTTRRGRRVRICPGRGSARGRRKRR